MNEMVLVKRANVVLNVPVGQKDEYISKGFAVIDANGKIVEAAAPKDAAALAVLNQKLKDKIKALEEENQVLKTQVDELNKELDSLAAEEDDQKGLVDSPKKGSSKKKAKE